MCGWSWCFSWHSARCSRRRRTWHVGANVKNKPQGLTLFTGGFPKYREYCAAVVQAGYRDFIFERELEPAEA